MPDDQYTGDGGLGFDYEDVPQAVAPPPPATFGYMYGSSRYANEPPVPRPTQAQLEALPANTLTDVPTGGWAYRETVPHHERLMQLDMEAQKAQQAAQFAAQDAQMFAQMSRVARSVKDIEIAKREIDYGIAQRRISNGEPPHQVFASMPGLFGSGAGYAAAVNATKPTPAPTIVPPSGSTPGYIQDPRGVPHFFPGSEQMMPTPKPEDLGKGITGFRVSPQHYQLFDTGTAKKLPIDVAQEVAWRNADIKAIQSQKEALLKAGTRADAPDIVKLDTAMEEHKNAVRALQKTPSGTPAPKPPANRVNVIGPLGPDGQPRRGTVPKGSKLPEGWIIAP